MAELSRLPYFFPTPVRRGAFKSLSPAHEALNVTTDLAAVASYGLGTDPTRAVAWCDYQSLPLRGHPWWLGAGRSGVVDGFYVKGIGRTMLCGNWGFADFGHNSGHLPPTAALREYLVTRYLEGCGLKESIVPCTGLLFAPLDPALVRFPEVQRQGRVPDSVHVDTPVNGLFQALSVKPHDFVRLSNFLYWLGRFAQTGPNGYEAFVLSLDAALTNGRATVAPGAARPEPASLVKKIGTTIARGLAHLRSHQERGVFWGSLRNNVTLDGRYLDLETALITGRPLPVHFDDTTRGAIPLPSRPGDPALVPGCEIVSYLFEWSLFLRYFAHAVRSLVELEALAKGALREHAAGVAEALGAAHELTYSVSREGAVAAATATASATMGYLGATDALRGVYDAFWKNLALGENGSYPPALLPKVPLATTLPGDITSDMSLFSFVPPAGLPADALELTTEAAQIIHATHKLRTVDQVLSGAKNAGDAMYALGAKARGFGGRT